MALDEAPPFWWEKPNWQAWLISPLGYLWGRAAAHRMASTAGESVSVPVICVGNFIVGGGGKTPTAIALAKHARKLKLIPGILSRGYGGAVTETTLVKPGEHNAHDVGDEPLLHAAHAKTVVSSDRVNGARLLIAQGCDVIIMDDGFQNPSLAKDFSLVAVDAKRGVGNGFTMPAGPMRVPLREQILHADSALVIGSGEAGDTIIRKLARSGKPVFHARMNVIGKTRWAKQEVIAFAGIADPEKFYTSLSEVGVKVIERQSFGDHHVYNEEECKELIATAKKKKLSLVTTEKDHIRLIGSGPAQTRLAKAAQAIAVELVFEDPATLDRIFEVAIRNCERRNLEKKSKPIAIQPQDPQ